jgi:very-short-patch-repair endonuclease
MSENPYIEYNSSNMDYARENRKKQTKAEEKMREFVLRKKQTGYKFSRQKPL